jgi:pimeloyl-ACP methyl ester carboxylesterase
MIMLGIRIVATVLLVFSLFGCHHSPAALHEDRFVDVPVQTVTVDGADMGYRVVGQGEPLLLVMGYAGCMDVWDPVLVSGLAEHFRVIMFDNRGMGYSGTGGADSMQELSMKTMARDALGVMHALGLERAHVLGWSMGSLIAQEMALESPRNVGKLILYGTAVDPAPVVAAVERLGRLSPEEFMKYLFPAPWVGEHPDVFKRLPAPAIPASPATVAAQYSAIARWQGASERVRSISKDTLVLVGENDPLTPPAQSIRTAELIPGAWLVRFRGGGHWLMYQNPATLARVIVDFLTVDQNLLHQ